jgi:hypothetical protein
VGGDGGVLYESVRLAGSLVKLGSLTSLFLGDRDSKECANREGRGIIYRFLLLLCLECFWRLSRFWGCFAFKSFMMSIFFYG